MARSWKLNQLYGQDHPMLVTAKLLKIIVKSSGGIGAAPGLYLAKALKSISFIRRCGNKPSD